eukprot:symbB.v1.2.035140.t2/scaffold4668.1/size36730/2
MKMVIGSKSELSDVWTRHFSRRSAADPMPEIDFEKEMVIWVASGVQGSGGYSTAVTQIVEVENELNIQVTFSCPPPGAGWEVPSPRGRYQIQSCREGQSNGGHRRDGDHVRR